MDPVEQATFEFLSSLNQDDVVYEPNGRDTAPDFSVGNLVAVEATRLVKLTGTDDQPVNVTQRHPSTIQSLRNVIESVDTGAFANSFFVGLRIREPVDIRMARRGLRDYLLSLSVESLRQGEWIRICPGLAVDITQAYSPKESKFRLGAISGPDFVGWVGDELIRQSSYAIKRKANIVRRIQNDYNEVWLAVASHLTLGDMSEYVPLLREHLSNVSGIQRLILVNTNRPAQSSFVTL